MFNKIKSPKTLFNSTEEFTVMNANILYITHEIDQIKKIVINIQRDAKLQHQVDEYFEDSPQEEEKESN